MSDRLQTEDQIRSVADRLNVFQDLESKQESFDQLSRDLTNNLFILLRSAGLYDLENQALDQPFESLLNSISGLYEILKTHISIRMNDGNFFVSRRLVKLDFSTYQNARYLIKIFDFLDINELSFDPAISRGDLKQLLTGFVRVVKEKKNNFKDLKIPHIESRKLKVGEVHPLLKAKNGSEAIASWYATACFVTQNFYKDTHEGRSPQHSLLKRTVLDLIEFPSRQQPLLSRLDLLAENSSRGDILFIHSVEAAGITALISDTLALSPELKLALATAALQLFQGWSLLEDNQIAYNDPKALHKVFTALESPRDTLTEVRNHIVRSLLDLGGVSESVIHRIIVTFEAQRGRESQWSSSSDHQVYARPSRAIKNSTLYRNGLTRSFLTDIVYGAHLYCFLRRQHTVTDTWVAFKKANLASEVVDVFYQSIGAYPYGTRVELNNGKQAIITQCAGDIVEGIAIIKGGGHPLKAHVEDRMELRSTSPIKVEHIIDDADHHLLNRETARALLFSRLSTEKV